MLVDTPQPVTDRIVLLDFNKIERMLVNSKLNGVKYKVELNTNSVADSFIKCNSTYAVAFKTGVDNVVRKRGRGTKNLTVGSSTMFYVSDLKFDADSRQISAKVLRDPPYMKKGIEPKLCTYNYPDSLSKNLTEGVVKLIPELEIVKSPKAVTLTKIKAIHVKRTEK